MSNSNYPPGVSGNEPEIAGYPEPPKCPLCDRKATGRGYGIFCTAHHAAEFGARAWRRSKKLQMLNWELLEALQITLRELSSAIATGTNYPEHCAVALMAARAAIAKAKGV